MLVRVQEWFMLVAAVGVMAPAVLESKVICDMSELAAVDQAGIDVVRAIELEASVNFCDPAWDNLFIQDGDNAMYVKLPSSLDAIGMKLAVGDRIRIQGTFDSESSVIHATNLVPLGQNLPADPLNLRLEGLAPGELCSRRVRLQGKVESALICDERCQFVMRQGDRRFYVRRRAPITLTKEQIEEELIGSEVDLTGTLVYLVDPSGRPTALLCHQMPHDAFEVTQKGMSRPPPTKLAAISDLANTPSNYVELSGQVTYIREFDLVVLEDDRGNGVSVYVPYVGDIQLGDMVSVRAQRISTEPIWPEPGKLALWQDSGGRSSQLVADLTRRHYPAPLPPPREQPARTVAGQKLHQQRRKVVGDVVVALSDGLHREVIAKQDGTQFAIQFRADDHQFQNFENARTVSAIGMVVANVAAPSPPSRTELTTATGENGETGNRPAFAVELATLDDLQVERRWIHLDANVVWLFAFAIGTALVIAGLLVFRLRRRVGRQQNDLRNLVSRLNSTYDAVREGLLVTDRRGRIIASNANVAKHLGIEPELLHRESSPEAFRQRLASQFESPQEFFALWDEALRDATLCKEIELQTRQPRVRAVVVYTAPVPCEPVSQEARIWSFDDISERRLLEAELVQSQKMQALGRLTGGIAHDFNNLLLGIMANIEVTRLRPELSVAEADKFLMSASQAAERAKKLVERMLGFSRKTKLDLQICDPNQIVERVAALLEGTVMVGVELSFDSVTYPWSIQVDPIHLEQVLLNICLNACDAIEGDVGRVTISTDNVPAELSPLDCDSVRFRVKDTGTGMSADVKAHVFDPFFTTKAPGKGTGLGLSMSMGLVQQHNGTIVCESAIGQGSQFDVYLPAEGRPAEAGNSPYPFAERLLRTTHSSHSPLGLRKKNAGREQPSLDASADVGQPGEVNVGQRGAENIV